MTMPPFRLQAPFKPTGDQPQAIAQLIQSLQGEHRFQALIRLDNARIELIVNT